MLLTLPRNFLIALLMFGALIRLGQAEDLLPLGIQALDQGDYPVAREYFQEAVISDPQNLEAWRLLGFTYRQMDSLIYALEAYRRVLQLDSSDYDAHLSLGALYALLGQYPAALRQYEIILERDSTDVEAWLGRARALSWQGDLSSAERSYRTALGVLPDYPRTLLGLAQTLSWQDKMSSASACYQRLLSQDSTYAEAWVGLGTVAQWLDRPYASLYYFQRTLDLDENDRNARTRREESELQTSLQLQPQYRYWVERDGDLKTEHEEISFSGSRRLSDLVGVTGHLRAYSSFRHGIFEYRRSVGGEAQFYPVLGVSLLTKLQMDLLSATTDLATLEVNWRGYDDWRWLAASAYYEYSLYEVWSQTRSAGSWLEVTLKPRSSLNATLGGGLWSLSDDNQRRQGLISVGWQLANKPVVTLIGRSRYLDFKQRVYGYYSPQEQLQHEIGAALDWQFSPPLAFSSAGYYALNSEEIRSLWLEGVLRWLPRPNFNFELSAQYFETNQDYRFLLGTLSLIILGLP